MVMESENWPQFVGTSITNVDTIINTIGTIVTSLDTTIMKSSKTLANMSNKYLLFHY